MATDTLDRAVTQSLIRALGGNMAVSAALNVDHSAVCNWQLEGRRIPWKHRPAIARLAAEKAVNLPADFWGRTIPTTADRGLAA